MMSHQNTNSLYIQQQDNILDGITLKEPFERNVLLQLVDSDLLRKHLTNTYAHRRYTRPRKTIKKVFGVAE
jgi:hypothetical protein